MNQRRTKINWRSFGIGMIVGGVLGNVIGWLWLG